MSMISAESTSTRPEKMAPRLQVRKYTVSLNRNLAYMFLVCFLVFPGLHNNLWQNNPPTATSRSCSVSTFSLFAEAVSVAVVGASLHDDDNAGEKEDNTDSRRSNAPTISSDRSLSGSTKSSIGEIFRKAGEKAIGGGIPGAIAGVVQVLTLMWLRTTINYQSRYGSSFLRTISILYNEGGIGRFYNGISFALFQAPFSRFVATASNDGVLFLLAALPLTKDWTPAVTTLFASLTVGAFRILLMPIDTCKTVLQVDSTEGFRALMRRVRAGKIRALYQGAAATAVSSTIAHYPWFVIYNGLSSAEWLKVLVPKSLFRNASIGLVASVVSDTIVNVFRVIKTTKQSIGASHDFSYSDTIRVIVAADGWKGLFGRGLRTRVLANAVQSILFTVIWRGLADRWGSKNESVTDSISKEESVTEGVRGSKRMHKHKQKQNTKPIAVNADESTNEKQS